MNSLVGKTLDQYKIVAEAGRGGMATVYRAIDTHTDREVALKILSPLMASDRRFIKRFRREGAILARMKHPHIVPVEGYGEAEGYIYLAMSFVRGKTMASYIKAGKVTLELCLRWVSQVADALEHAHQLGIIHRDVKPSNIIIDEKGNAQLTDFGLARHIEGSNTLTGSMLIGTPAYMAPEQARGVRSNALSDQYALGVILYEIVAGRLPFDEESPLATALLQVSEPVPPPTRFNDKLSVDVERVILRSLAKDPDYRYPSVHVMTEAFFDAWGGEAGSDEPTRILRGKSRQSMPAPAEKINRTRRSWFVVGIALVVALSLAAGFALLRLLLAGLNSDDDLPMMLPTAVLIDLETEESAAENETVELLITPTSVVQTDCPGISLFDFRRQGEKISWHLDNSGTTEIQLREIELTTPEDNWLVGFKMKGQELYVLDAESPPDEQVAFSVPAGERSSIAAGSTVLFKLTFAYSDSQPGYGMVLYLDDTCQLETTW